MMLSVRRVAAAAPAPARTQRPALPLRSSRLSVRAQAMPPNNEEPSKSTQTGTVPTKDLSDISPPTSLRDVGAAVREATPKYAPAFQAPPLVPTFSRRREDFAGRLAMLGFAAACAWEILLPTHPGPIGVTAELTGWSIGAVKLVYGAIVAHGLLGLLWPGAPTFDRRNFEDYMRRPAGPPTTMVNPFTQPSKFFGCSPYWGFTKKNDLFQGRLAMLGFLAAIINEAQTGTGPVGQVAWWLGKTATNDWYRSAGMGLISFSIIAIGLSWATGHAGTTEGEEDIY